MSAREVVQELLDEAIADGAHPERIAALAEAVDAVSAWQAGVGRYDHAAAEVKKRARNDESIDRASRRWQDWTSAEMDLLDRDDLTSAEIAQLLGRSIKGVKRKRQRMREAAVAALAAAECTVH